MPDFTYSARNLHGEQVTGVLSAATEREVMSMLSAKDLFPVQVKEGKTAHAKGKAIRVRAKHVAPVFTQLAALLRSGVPLLRSLSVLKEQSSNEALVAVLTDIHARVEDGQTLADAMSYHTKAFGELEVGIIRAGGEGGFLEDALDRVATFTEQQDDLKARVQGALAYPVFLGVVGFIVVNVLVIFFVPKFETLFQQLRERGELPWITEAVVGLSHTLQSYGLFVLLGVFLVGWFIKNRLETEEGKWFLDRWKIKIPQAGAIYLQLAVARFTRVLGTLLTGGVPIVKSLNISAEAAGNRVLGKAIKEAADNITAGESLAPPLTASGYFPKNVTEMIAVAEESNTLEKVLTQIADTLEKETWRKLDLFVRLLEPVMLLILASAVLVVVLALLLPVLKMSMTI